MPSVEQIDGWWWPKEDRHARRLIPQEAERDIPMLLEFVIGRRLIVQAGANTGWWAMALAEAFDVVVTVEPDATNYECLLLNNLSAKVHSLHAAFGERAGWAGVELGEEDNYGSARLCAGNSTRVITIDSLNLKACNAIWLDTEGTELSALKGAEQTIRRLRPTIAVEEKGLGENYGNARESIWTWLTALGYREVGAVARDVVYLSS